MKQIFIWYSWNIKSVPSILSFESYQHLKVEAYENSLLIQGTVNEKGFNHIDVMLSIVTSLNNFLLDMYYATHNLFESCYYMYYL